MSSKSTLEKLHLIDKENRHLERAVAVLRWDQETYLPEDGVEDRSEQLAILESYAHEKLTSAETGRLLSELGSTTENPNGDEKLPPMERDFLKVFGATTTGRLSFRLLLYPTLPRQRGFPRPHG